MAAGDLAGADVWFLNALARHPGDVRVLRDFAEAMASDAEQLQWLEGFVHERVAHVEPQDVPALQQLIADVRARRLSLPAAEPVEAEPAPDPFELVRGQVEGLLARCAEAPLATAGHLLQAADGLVRQLVLLDPVRAIAPLEAVEAQARAVSERQARQASDRSWAAFCADHQATWETKWSPPAGTAGKKRACQDRIEALQAAQGALVRLALVEPALAEARTVQTQLDALLEAATQAQRRRYERWALARIRRALEQGRAHMGLRDDEEAIAKALYETLATVEPAWLGQAANRAWSEVFELLFARLDKVKSEDDFDAPGTKLHALKRMAAATRKRPQAF